MRFDASNRFETWKQGILVDWIERQRDRHVRDVLWCPNVQSIESRRI
jgi:hypothetical protein